MISFGSDPEFMLTDVKGNLKSAIGIVPGTKEKRHDLGHNHRMYYDNVLAECEIAPATSAEDAVKKFRDCFQRAAKLIKPYKLNIRASATFPESECQHDDAKVFGCDPEYDAYDIQVIMPPACMEGNYFRSAGGHVHIGFEGGADLPDVDEETMFAIAWNRIWVVRMCDLFLGIPSLLMDRDPTSIERRKLYGGAGSHRICEKYGVEYRALSNFWLAKPSLVTLMYNLAEQAVHTVMDRRRHEEIWEKRINESQLREIINTGNVDKAWDYFSVVCDYVGRKLASEIKMHSEEIKPADFYKAWELV